MKKETVEEGFVYIAPPLPAALLSVKVEPLTVRLLVVKIAPPLLLILLFEKLELVIVRSQLV